MVVRAFHPILYVADPYVERDFFVRFGFGTIYEGDEFPGFLAVECGPVCFGLSNNRRLTASTAHDGVRWQLIVDDVDEIERQHLPTEADENGAGSGRCDAP